MRRCSPSSPRSFSRWRHSSQSGRSLTIIARCTPGDQGVVCGVFVVAGDGSSGVTYVGDGIEPGWSNDGSRIAFVEPRAFHQRLDVRFRERRQLEGSDRVSEPRRHPQTECDNPRASRSVAVNDGPADRGWLPSRTRARKRPTPASSCSPPTATIRATCGRFPPNQFAACRRARRLPSPAMIRPRVVSCLHTAAGSGWTS